MSEHCADRCAGDEIRSLLARLAHRADDGELDDYLELLTEDAVWEMPANPAVGAPADRRTGRADIAAGVRDRRARGLQGPGTASRHTVLTIDVTVVSADEARSVAYWQFVTGTDSSPRLASVGRYDDRLRRVDGRWLLAHRRITVG